MSQQINLLPSRRHPAAAIAAPGAALVLAVLALATYASSASSEISGLRSKKAAGELRIEQLQKSAKAALAPKLAGESEASLAAEISALRPRAEVARQLMAGVRTGTLGNPQGYARHFAALSAAGQEGVWVTGMAVGKSGLEVAVSGRALRGPSVMEFAGRLNQAFQPLEAKFKSVEISPDAGGRNAPESAATPVTFRLY